MLKNVCRERNEKRGGEREREREVREREEGGVERGSRDFFFVGGGGGVELKVNRYIIKRGRRKNERGMRRQSVK